MLAPRNVADEGETQACMASAAGYDNLQSWRANCSCAGARPTLGFAPASQEAPVPIV